MTRLQRAALASGLSGILAIVATGMALAGTGQPSPGQIGMQGAATDIADAIHWFHDFVNFIIIAIALFVLALLLIVIFRFNERANPTPSKTTHNSLLEVVWTVVPILILVVIALPSFKLLFAQYTYPKPDLVLKATGNQWNWTYAYPDHALANGRPVSFTSIILTDKEREERIKKGIPAPRLLAVDNEVVVPVGKNVHVIVTASDVIHNWTVPSFGSKVDAVPGRTTATWFRARQEGIYYGQCSELCGKDHAFMPIAVRVVSQGVFDAWIAAQKARDRKKAQEIIEKAAIEHAKKPVAAIGETEKVASAATTR
ncbi:MAG: cytochrome c oxidase subunit II [Hyphomicrobiaceae bacterium]